MPTSVMLYKLFWDGPANLIREGKLTNNMLLYFLLGVVSMHYYLPSCLPCMIVYKLMDIILFTGPYISGNASVMCKYVLMCQMRNIIRILFLFFKHK